MYKFIGKEFDRKFIVVGKENGCGKCKNLKSFLEHAVGGEYDDQITNIKFESNPEDYKKAVDATESMSLPIMINLETGKHINGFNPPEIMELLKS